MPITIVYSNRITQLPRLYNEVLNHPSTQDELRRETEAKLLHLKQRHLFALPATGKKTEKAQLASELNELVSGMVLLNIPEELAWTLMIESKDAAEIGWFPTSLCSIPVLTEVAVEDYDFNLLRQFIGLFPRSPLTKLMRAYFEYMGVPLSEDEDGVVPAPLAEDEADYIDIMMVSCAFIYSCPSLIQWITGCVL